MNDFNKKNLFWGVKMIAVTLMILIAIACPFIIEFLQFLGNCLVGSVLRDVSMSDFVLNAIGLLIGYGFYVLFFSGAKSGRKKSGKGK